VRGELNPSSKKEKEQKKRAFLLWSCMTGKKRLRTPVFVVTAANATVNVRRC